jgi:hypothetical protein
VAGSCCLTEFWVRLAADSVQTGIFENPVAAIEPVAEFHALTKAG